MEASGTLGTLLGRERWRLASWIGAVSLAVLFAHQAILPLAERLTAARAELAALKENTYESSWLDSTQAALEEETGLLKSFHASRRSALSSDSSVQAAVDRIRAVAQASGIEVIKTTPVVARAEPLGMLKVKVEGFSRFPGLMDFFSVLRLRHPDLFLEEMLVRQGGERAGGRLETLLVLQTYAQGRDALR